MPVNDMKTFVMDALRHSETGKRHSALYCRSRSVQAALFADPCPLVCPPCISIHETGMALRQAGNLERLASFPVMLVGFIHGGEGNPRKGRRAGKELGRSYVTWN